MFVGTLCVFLLTFTWKESFGCCSSSGTGETRVVVCRDSNDYGSTHGCNNASGPAETQRLLDGPVMQRLPTENLPWLKRFRSPSSTVFTDPNYVVGNWEECSVSCGKGTRKRKVECQILLEFSQTIATLPDSHCLGPKPSEMEYCFVPCPEFEEEAGNNKENAEDIMEKSGSGGGGGSSSSSSSTSTHQNETNNKINFGNKLPKSLESAALALSSNRIDSPLTKQHTYSWRSSGFTQCSASCLGGTQESVIQCVRDADLEVSSPYLCDINEKPESITKTCNDHSCPPRWNISEYMPCSKSCGGGVQVREINCIHEVTRGAENTLVVPEDRCPRPPPRSKKFCNVFDCPARWKPEPWSKCPKACGGGMKTRKLKCIKELAFGQIQEQPPSRCPKKKPRITKICNKKACKHFSKHHESKTMSYSIVSNDLVYIQKEPMKRVSVKAGGKAVIFKGTTLKIRCPHKRAQNKTAHANWFKDGSRIKPSTKHLITSRGTLRIKQISYGEAGVYTCAQGHIKTNIQIMVKPPINKYSSEENSIENPTPRSSSNNWNTYSRNKMLTKDNEVDAALKRPEAITTFQNKEEGSYPILNSISTESPSSSSSTKFTVHFPIEDLAGVPVIDVNTDSRELYGRFSTTARTTTNAPTPTTTTEAYNGWGTGDGMARSGATSHHQAPISQLQQLLSNLRHTFQSTNLSFKHTTPTQVGASSNKPLTPTPPPPQMLIADSVILGKGSPENLHFDWIISDWSSCSQPCGGSGFQVRASQCLVRFNNVSKRVDENLCVDVGLDPPLTIRECGLDECPKWKTSEWSTCEDCKGHQTGFRTRIVACSLSNGTELSQHHCNQSSKPVHQMDCVNRHCRPMWTTSEWSKCTGRCGEEGFQSRSLQCVWTRSQKSAGSLCENLPRPSILRSCHNNCLDKPNNNNNNNNCVDKSNHCSLAKALDMCRIAHYRRRCCATCKMEVDFDREVYLDREKRGHRGTGSE